MEERMPAVPPDPDANASAPEQSAEPLPGVPWIFPTNAHRRPTDADDEELGGDPPCWAHLFEDEDEDSPR
jgi:hypothetical protein